MSAIPGFDAVTKRWLVGLAGTCVALLFLIVYVLMAAVHRAEEQCAAPIQTATVEEKPTDEPEFVWTTPVPASPEVSYFPAPVPPGQGVAVTQAEYVHRQAEYLRKMIQSEKGRKAFGNLTPEKIDEMEKKGITVN